MLLDDFTARKIALCISLAGIALILFLSTTVKPIEVKVSEINESLENKRIATSGIIQNLAKTDKAVFFSLVDGKKIRAVIFSPKKEAMEVIDENRLVKVKGAVAKYRGALEIIVEKVIPID
ncbi:MAG: OB-fold nucleic acid binding domain-containing protein [Candidatus Diapherotrites archaeon]